MNRNFPLESSLSRRTKYHADIPTAVTIMNSKTSADMRLVPQRFMGFTASTKYFTRPTYNLSISAKRAYRLEALDPASDFILFFNVNLQPDTFQLRSSTN